MKKLLCFGMVIATLLCLALSGCKSDHIDYAAQEPVFYFTHEAWKSREELEEGEIGWTINGCEPVANFNSYMEFSQYYLSNLNEEKTYLLYRDNEIPPLTREDEGTFIFFREKGSGNLILNESYNYYDKSLGPKKSYGPYKPVSIHIDIFIKAIDEFDLDSLVLVFGILKNPYYGRDKYINFYSGEQCFATCYYTALVKISREWYVNYFKTNFIFGNNL